MSDNTNNLYEKRIISITRKCACCKADMNITKYNISDYVYFDNKAYHKSCFDKLLDSYLARVAQGRISVKKQYALNHKNEIYKASYNHFSDMLNKEYLFDFIKSQYDITVIPSYIWHKLSNIYSGKFKGLTEGKGIPPTHLLDMWKRKMSKLNNIAEQNRKKNIIMTPEQRLNYDISVLVNMYDSYLRFLNKQKVLANEVENNKQSNNDGLSLSYFQKLSNSNKVENDDADISTMVDEIFG